MRFNYKKDFGNQSMIFANGADGYIYFDTVLKCLGDASLDEIINSLNMIVLAKDNRIQIRCAIWVENNEWHPIIKFSQDNKYYLLDDDWIFYQELKGNTEDVSYIKLQLECCKQLAEIIKDYVL